MQMGYQGFVGKSHQDQFQRFRGKYGELVSANAQRMVQVCMKVFQSKKTVVT